MHGYGDGFLRCFKEGEQVYTIKAGIPGVKKEDIKIDINGNQVAFSAEVKREQEDKQGEYVRTKLIWVNFFGAPCEKLLAMH